MRITNGMMLNDALNNLNQSRVLMDTYQEQLSSGKTVEKPSDDPARATDIMRFESALAGNGQYRRNADDGVNWLSVADSALGHLTEVMHRARQLAVQGADATLPDNVRQSLGIELQQLVNNTLQVAQTSYTGRYVFSGTATGTTPIVTAGLPPTSATYAGNNQTIQREIGPGIYENINVPGNQIFTGANGVLPALFQLSADVLANNQSAISADIQPLDDAISNLLGVRSNIGAKVNRLEVAKDWMEGDELNLTQLLSNSQDADVAKVITSLTTAENTYRAGLAVSARILPPTLVDFLR